MSLHPVRRGFGLAAAGLMGLASVSAATPASAQQVLTEEQCSNAVSIAHAIVQKYQGTISRNLIDSFVRFGESKCDLNTNFATTDGTKDETAFGEFRLKLIALRTVAANKPAALTR